MKKLEELKHPDQPLGLDEEGIIRFKPNAIIGYLFQSGKEFDLNDLACIPFPDEDRVQLAQLLGYTLGGFSELSYVSDEAYKRVDRTK